MRLQQVQSQQNYQNPNFKAKFINDANGYFRRMWRAVEITDGFRGQVDEFTRKYPDHKLEIIDYKTKSSCMYLYDIFNHKTGKTTSVQMGTDVDYRGTLPYILYKLMIINRDIFKEDGISEVYKNLVEG